MPTTVRSSLLRNFRPRSLTFLVSRTRSPIAMSIFSRSNTLNLRAWSSGKTFSTPSFPTMAAPSLQSSRERITGQLPGAQLRNQRLRRSVAPPDCGDETGQKGHEVRKSTSNSGQMGRIGQKQPEKEQQTATDTR